MPAVAAAFGNGNPALSLAWFGLFVLPVVAFYVFVAYCLWRLASAAEEISLSLAKIAAKTKDDGGV